MTDQNKAPTPVAETAGEAANRNEAKAVLGWFSGLARKEGQHVQADWLDSYIASLSPSPVPAQDDDKLWIAVEALEATKNRIREWPIDDQETCMCGSPVSGHGMGDGHSPVSQGDHAISMIVEAIDEALAALQQETQP